METICIFPDEQERQELFAYLNELEIEYHKPYKRFNQTVKVPRGQASFTRCGVCRRACSGVRPLPGQVIVFCPAIVPMSQESGVLAKLSNIRRVGMRLSQFQKFG